MSRIPFKVTPDLRTKVKSMAATGVAQEDIATIIGCSAKTLRKHLRNELDRGMAEATVTIAGELFKLVQAGDVGAQVFWHKTRTGAGSNGTAEGGLVTGDEPAPPSSHPIILIPDNKRSPATTERAEGILQEARALLKKSQERKASEAKRYRAKRARSKPDPKE